MIKKILLMILMIALSEICLGQLFTGHNAKFFYFNYYVEIKNDTAFLEIFKNVMTDDQHYIVYDIGENNSKLFPYIPYESSSKVYEFVLIRNSLAKGASYHDNNFKLKKHREYCTLTYNAAFINKWERAEKRKRVRLSLCTMDKRLLLRKKNYYYQKHFHLLHLVDSLQCPKKNQVEDYQFLKSSIWNDSVSYPNFVASADEYYENLDSLATQHIDPVVDKYYKASDSIRQIDSTTIFNLLRDGNYNYDYSNYFLYQVAIKRPETLVNFVDRNQKNKRLLNAIRNHPDIKQIHRQIKNVTTDSKGKKLILKQRTNGIFLDIAGVCVYTLATVGEIALVVGLIKWIF